MDSLFTGITKQINMPYDDKRPNPDELLSSIQSREEKARKGKLKIFFGMCAGVGKTYSMLNDAINLMNSGRDVVVGYIETHNRRETVELDYWLPHIPRKKIEYKNTVLEEMDLDAILAKKPEIVLVDELAHTNVEGSRHLKRYQDILELLDNGISVHTALNVQHLESRSDAVREITGITVHETVPDFIFTEADEVEIIDIPPDELLIRLNEGKVYTPEKTKTAAENFFRIGNLTALREMSLRLVAERVDKQLKTYMRENRIEGPWRSGEKFMIVVSPDFDSAQLIRWARRKASAENKWIALYREPKHPVSKTKENILTRNLNMARELGAEIISAADDDWVSGILRIAKQENITQIVLPKPDGFKWDFLFGRINLNRLLKESDNVDIHLIRITRKSHKIPSFAHLLKIESGWQQYLYSALFISLVSFICFISNPFLEYQAVGIILLFSVALASLFVGRGPIFLTSGLSAILWNFFFIPPVFTFAIYKLTDALMVSMYFIVAIITGIQTSKLRTQERMVRLREQKTSALYQLSKALSASANIENVVSTAADQIWTYFQAKVAFYFETAEGTISSAAHPLSTFSPDEREWAVVFWVYNNRKPAGKFTHTLPLSEGYYIPLFSHGKVFGVFGIRYQSQQTPPVDQETLLENFVTQISSALEKEMLNESAKKSMMLQESERLYKTLFNSISHELKTPLSIIKAASSGLSEQDVLKNGNLYKALVSEIQEASSRLNKLVENLLDMSRLETGLMRINLEWCDVSELVNKVVSEIKKENRHHFFQIQIKKDLPLVKLDFVLIEQVLLNIFNNCVLYTPEGTQIELDADLKDDRLKLVISDNGAGFPEQSVPFLFEKFYRIPGSKTGGTGLGLAISKGFIEAHHGTVKAENKKPNGAKFTIEIPVEINNLKVSED